MIHRYTIRTVLGLLFSLLSFSCNRKNEPVITELTTRGLDATAPYFSTDQHGNPILCWSEKSSEDSLYLLRYARFNPDEERFSEPVTVQVSAGMSVSPEAMGKVAFKEDGTVVAMFAQRFEQEKNPFAGAIYYSLSNDDGKHWSERFYLHSDSSHAYGRSFFDIARLNNGELAAVWLDGRFRKELKGSALFFSRTSKGKGFSNEQCLKKGTCECCRTDLLSDKAGNLHVAFRDIHYPEGLVGPQARDMAYMVSADNGNTFSKPALISQDNWRIEGCPHSGPTIASVGDKVRAVWFSEGGGTGMYYTSGNSRAGFQRRQLLSLNGRHPQLTALSNGLALVYEDIKEPEEHLSSHSNMGHESHQDHAQNSHAVIRLTLFDENGEQETRSVTSGEERDHHPVICSFGKKILLAWVREKQGRSGICYTLLEQER